MGFVTCNGRSGRVGLVSEGNVFVGGRGGRVGEKEEEEREHCWRQHGAAAALRFANRCVAVK